MFTKNLGELGGVDYILEMQGLQVEEMIWVFLYADRVVASSNFSQSIIRERRQKEGR